RGRGGSRGKDRRGGRACSPNRARDWPSNPPLLDGFGRRRLAPVAAGRLVLAIEAGDAALIQRRALQRAAFLGDPPGAEGRVAAHELLVLPAFAHVALRFAVAGRLRRRRAGHQAQRRRQPDPPPLRHGCVPQPTIVSPPLTLSTWPVM